MLLEILRCCMGFALLYYGAHWLVTGASRLAGSLGVSPLVVGLTVVAFGTSAPELVVSVVSSLGGQSMIAIGNVVGSNICNITLVLGISALFHPISSNPAILRRDIPLMLGISLYLAVLSLNSVIGRGEGFSLFVGVLLYTWFNYRNARRGGERAAAVAPDAAGAGRAVPRAKQICLILIGIAGVVGGAELVVDAAVNIMTVLGVSERFIGLTVVAFGTSLPELATSVVAATKKEMDIGIGNLVGSNVFNILGVVGVAAMVRPITIPGGFVHSGLVVDYGVMMATGALPWLLMRKNGTITRRGGCVLLFCYVAYIVYLVMA